MPVSLASIVLPLRFFERPTLDVAHDLLGKFLVSRTEEGTIRAMITEVEAYDGPQDKACHASKGLTERTAPMFGPAGHWYVYMIYGMYWMLNIVTREEGYPAAVLIRGVAMDFSCHGELCRTTKLVTRKIHCSHLNGPGRLTRAMGIDKRFNTLPANQKTGLWIEDRGVSFSKKQIKRTTRIGVEYAGEWAKKEWRFEIQ